MAISSPGIGSNLDVNGIVSKLMSVESQPLIQMAKKEANYQAQLSAYGSLSASLSSFQSALSGLNNLSNYQSFSASAADSTILSASASSTAIAGSYSINVTALSQSQSLMVAGQTSSSTSLGNGADTLSFQFGTSGTPASFGAAKTVSIAPNSSLQTIANSVNAANIGVSATIVNDGSASPYRLVFTSTNTGAANSMSVTAAGDATLQGLMTYDQVSVGGVQNMTQTAAAQDAALTLNGISIHSASNAVSGAIDGVTLNLSKIGSTTLSVQRNSSAVKNAVQGFVTAYNALNKTFGDLTSYDSKTKEAGPLLGDSVVRNIQNKIRSVLSNPLPGGSSGYNNLSQVGVSFQKDGSLMLDSSKLDTAISNNSGAIAGVFAAAGTITDSLISFSASTASSKPGSYGIELTAIASQGVSTGNVNLNLANTTIAAGTSINVTLDGVSSPVALAAGSFTAAQLASMIQSAINGTAAFASNSSSVTAKIDTSGFLSVTSNRYGSASNVSMADSAGTTVATFMGTATSTAGVDVAGSIGGTSSTGSGQYLTSFDGLKLHINGGVTGLRGTVNFSQGYAYQLNSVLADFLGGSSLITSRTNGINSSITDIGKQREALSLRLATTEQRYRDQFTRLDTLISSMNQTSNFLTQQLANIPKAGG